MNTSGRAYITVSVANAVLSLASMGFHALGSTLPERLHAAYFWISLHVLPWFSVGILALVLARKVHPRRVFLALSSGHLILALLWSILGLVPMPGLALLTTFSWIRLACTVALPAWGIAMVRRLDTSPGPGRVSLAGLGLRAAALVAIAMLVPIPRPPAAPALEATAAAPARVVVEGITEDLLHPPGAILAEEAFPSVVRRGNDVRLVIADRRSDPGAPRQGWCGESAIQQALLYHGQYMPQSFVNAAGRPRQPDLHAGEVPRAILACGAGIATWSVRSGDYAAFTAWLRREIDSGHPVVVGMKLNPDRHPSWPLDHFLLAVGHGDSSLIYNTTWGEQATGSFAFLATGKGRMTFRNRHHSHYGIAVTGPSGLDSSFAHVRLFAGEAESGRVPLVVRCEDLVPGRRYVVYRLGSLHQATVRPRAVFDATAPAFAFADTVPAADVAIYRCSRMPSPPAS